METINQQLANALERIKEQDKELENAENTYYEMKGELDNANKRIKELESNEQAMNDAHCKLMDKLEAAKPKWISVKDRMPNLYEDVVLFDTKFNDTVVGHLEEFQAGVRWTDNKYSWDINAFTHWMPLPPPPTDDSKETEKWKDITLYSVGDSGVVMDKDEADAMLNANEEQLGDGE